LFDEVLPYTVNGFAHVLKYGTCLNPFHNQLSPWSRVLIEKLIVTQQVKKFPTFLEPEGSFLWSQHSGTCPYPETDASNATLPPYFLKIHPNIILPSIPKSSEWCLPLIFSYQNFICAELFKQAFCIFHWYALNQCSHKLVGWDVYWHHQT